MSNNVDMVIYGEPCSKANSRRLVKSKSGRPLFIKSQKALAYVKSFGEQCKTLDPLMEDDVAVLIKIYYGSRRPDLDESLILDCMQGLIYKNIGRSKKSTSFGEGTKKIHAQR